MNLSDLSDEQLASLYNQSGQTSARPLSDWSDDELKAAWQSQAGPYVDLAKQLASGLVIGAENIPAAPARLADLATRGLRHVAPNIGDPEAEAQQDELKRLIAANRGEGVANYLPKPETTAGEYARTAGEFIPGMAALPGGVDRNAATGAVAGLASEGGGQLYEGTPQEGAARVAGALVGGLGAGRALAPRAASRAARVTSEDARG